MEIPTGEKKIIYRLTAGELHREIPSQNHSWLVLEKIKASEMKTEPRDGVTAWRWELELTPRRKETHFSLLFTFESAQSKP